MGTSDIEAAINTTVEKKEDLRKAFEALQSQSNSLVSFTLQWKHIEDHLSSIQKSIEERFRELKDLDSSLAVNKFVATHPSAKSAAAATLVAKKATISTLAAKRATISTPEAKKESASSPLAKKAVISTSLAKKAASSPLSLKVDKQQDKPELQPRSELKTLCLEMNGKGLRSFIIDNRKDIVAISSELGAALRSAPDPVTLVLDSLDGFVPSKKMSDGEILSIRRTCLTLLECLHDLSLVINPLAKDRARGVAVEWKKLVSDGKRDASLVILGVLHLVATFKLAELFETDEILDLIARVARRKNIIDLCKSSTLDDNIPNLIEKLNDTGKQVDAVKFAIAFNLTDKYPPVSLLNAYIKESKNAAQEVRRKGNNSAQSKNEAKSKEFAALKAVIKCVEEYDLRSVFSTENLQKRIEQLENQKTEKKMEKMTENPVKKRGALSIAASDSNGRGQNQQQKRPNKRSRSSASTAPVLAPHNHTQRGLVDRVPFIGFSESYNLSAVPPLYDRGSASLLSSNSTIGLGGSHGSPKPYRYPPQSLAGPAFYDNRDHYLSDSVMGPAYYDRPVTNSGYGNSGLPPAPYHSSFYF